MRYDVKITEQAHAEAVFAFTWIEQESPQNAVEWFNGLVDVIESLCLMPERCAIAAESEYVGQEIRQLLYGKFRILFSIEKGTVYILHLRHGAQMRLSKEKF